MPQLIYIVLSYLIIITLGVLSFVIFTFGSAKVISIVIPTSQTEGLGMLGFGVLATLIGLLAAVLSLLPSYKICMKMAENLRFRGWPLYHPRRLFALALFLLILPFILLMLSGIVLGGVI
ncbi:MAG: hypothetical protein FJ044_04075 [Candidatus Cloacimonetes bacterium]|nr:hypothetical protein [Candidatus Cloacimonadota bacterium]